MPDRVLFEFGTLKIDVLHTLEYAGLVGLPVVLLALSRLYWKRRLTRWAEIQQVQIVHFRGARFYEGPSAWTRSTNQHLFRVVARDRQGRDRSCWIMFGTPWGFTWGEPLSEVIWDDAQT